MTEESFKTQCSKYFQIFLKYHRLGVGISQPLQWLVQHHQLLQHLEQLLHLACLLPYLPCQAYLLAYRQHQVADALNLLLLVVELLNLSQLVGIKPLDSFITLVHDGLHDILGDLVHSWQRSCHSACHPLP